MTGLLICAAVVACPGWALSVGGGYQGAKRDEDAARLGMSAGLALIAAALYLAWRAGGAV